ncbi:SNARE associated Golgi protein, putative [Plasmodium ovale]|uniref:SNARE associated Golgi protein, putative n=1 Tax=Plasmodium ovale TaxID=36330 RepID=A0A1D3TIT4_PLAOA|nr:SNARE associated Golgi protein, putative [Plasmodium ovale]
MENIEKHKSKKYEYLSSNYDTIYNKDSKDNELLNKNCNSAVIYNYDHNLLNESNSNTRINSYSNNMKDYSNEDSYHYGKNNSKYSKSMEKVKLINSNKSLHQGNSNRYNNLNYDNNEEDCSETHYHFENKYNHEKDLESNRILIDSDELIRSRRNNMRTKMQIVVKALIIIAIFFLLVFLITKFKKFLTIINIIIQWVGEQGSWSILLFILLFTFLAPFFMSVEIMCVGAGLIFSGVYGKLLGILVAVFSVATGYVLGMSICFFISRYLMHDYIYKKLMVYPIYLAFNQAINSNGLSFVLLIRLSPILPASVVSYILGVTSLKYREFALGSVSALPSICLFVYIGVLLQDISNISELEHHWSNLIILFIGFILGVVAIAYISVVTKRRLNNLNIMNTSLSTTNIDIE